MSLPAAMNLAHLAPLPRDRSIGIGCIGAGFIMAECHLVAYLAAGLKPVAIFAPRRAAAEEVAARHGIPTVHADWRGVVEDRAVEVVDIAVPPDVQPGIIEEICALVERKEARVRGILAQKPLAGDFPTAARLPTMSRRDS